MVPRLNASPGRLRPFAAGRAPDLSRKTIMGKRLDYLVRMWQLRYFWWSLASNDLSKRYKRSFLGIGWSLVRPLSMTAILCVVFAKVFKEDIATYAPYLLLGMTIWQFLTECILQGCRSFEHGATYIRQQQVPLAIFPLRTVLGSGFHALIALLMALGFVLFFQRSISPVALFYVIPGLIALFLIGWFLAIISGVAQTHFPDTSHLLEIGMQIAFYVTPILYKPEAIAERGRLLTLLRWNPFGSMLAVVRTPILDGTLPASRDIAMCLLTLAALGSVTVFLLRKLERTLVFWI